MTEGKKASSISRDDAVKIILEAEEANKKKFLERYKTLVQETGYNLVPTFIAVGGKVSQSLQVQPVKDQ